MEKHRQIKKHMEKLRTKRRNTMENTDNHKKHRNRHGIHHGKKHTQYVEKTCKQHRRTMDKYLKKQWTTIEQIGHPFLTHEKIYGIHVTSRSDRYHPHGKISFKDNDCFSKDCLKPTKDYKTSMGHQSISIRIQVLKLRISGRTISGGYILKQQPA